MVRAHNYSYAIERSLEVLEESGITSFPVSLKMIIDRYNTSIKVVSYKYFMNRFGISRYQAILLFQSKHGSTKRIGFSQYLIAYNDEKSDQISRSTIAHELGHIFLGHHEEYDDNSDKELYKVIEDEAWCFARNLLAPAYHTKQLLNKHGFEFTSPDNGFHAIWERRQFTEATINLKTSFSPGLLLEKAFDITEKAAETRLDLFAADYEKYRSRNLNWRGTSGIEQTADWRCNSCSAQRIPEALYCVECGKKGRFTFGVSLSKRFFKLPLSEKGRSDHCYVCGNQDIGDAAVYCKKCGAPLVNICTGLEKRSNRPDSKFCLYCGSKTLIYDYCLKNELKSVNGGVNMSEDLKIEIPFEEKTFHVLKCPRCGNDSFSRGAEYCKKCGLTLVNRCVPEQIDTDSYGEPVFRVQHDNVPDACYCEQCGRPTLYLSFGILKSWNGVYEKEQAQENQNETKGEDFDADVIPF